MKIPGFTAEASFFEATQYRGERSGPFHSGSFPVWVAAFSVPTPAPPPPDPECYRRCMEMCTKQRRPRCDEVCTLRCTGFSPTTLP